MYSKVYSVGRLTFKVEVTEFELSLIRLPVIPVSTQDNQSYHEDQMCTVYFKQGIAERAAQHGVTNEEFIGMCNDNAGFDSDHFVVVEYTGRDGSSENLRPDTALDGFMEWEIEQALTTLEQDSRLIAYLNDGLMDKQLLG